MVVLCSVFYIEYSLYRYHKDEIFSLKLLLQRENLLLFRASTGYTTTTKLSLLSSTRTSFFFAFFSKMSSELYMCVCLCLLKKKKKRLMPTTTRRRTLLRLQMLIATYREPARYSFSSSFLTKIEEDEEEKRNGDP